MTRLYLTNTAGSDSVVAPAGGIDRLMSTSKAGTQTTLTFSTPQASMAYFVSPLLSADVSLSGTCNVCVGISGNNDVDYYVDVIEGNATGQNFSRIWANAAGDFSPTPAAGFNPAGGLILQNPVIARAGQRLLFSMTNWDGTSVLYYGGTGGTDLTEGDTNVTTRPGWIEFSDTLSFGASNLGVAQRGMLELFR